MGNSTSQEGYCENSKGKEVRMDQALLQVEPFTK